MISRTLRHSFLFAFAIALAVQTAPSGAVNLNEPLARIGGQLRSAYDNYISIGMPRVVVTTWQDHLSVGQQILFDQDANGRLHGFMTQNLVLPEEFHCEDLLVTSQHFALSKMRESGYISQSQMDTLIRLGDSLDARQFRFFEAIRKIDDPNFRVDVSPGKSQVSLGAAVWMRDEVGLTDATLWTVAAQTTSKSVKKQFHKLPFQLDEAYSKVVLDREVYRTAWEVGRAAQNTPGSHAMLSAAAALSMAREVLVRGESLADAYIFVHSLGPVQNRLFKRGGLFSTFASRTANEDEVLVARLSDYLEHLPPENISRENHELILASGGKFNREVAMRLFIMVENISRKEVDVVVPRFGAIAQPVVLVNASMRREVFFNDVTHAHGATVRVTAINQRLGAKSIYPSNPNQRQTELDPTMEAVVPGQLFAISNLEPGLAAQNGDYVKLMLMAAYFHFRGLIPAEASMIARHYVEDGLRFRRGRYRAGKTWSSRGRTLRQRFTSRIPEL